MKREGLRGTAGDFLERLFQGCWIMPDDLKLLGVFVMSAVYHSCSQLSVSPRQRPWGELVGTLLSPKNKLPGIARHGNGQWSDSQKASCIPPYNLLESGAICHPQNREGGRMSWVEGGDVAWASESCHRGPGRLLCVGGGYSCVPGPGVPSLPLAPPSLRGDMSSCCPQVNWGLRGRGIKWIDSVSCPVPWRQQQGTEGNEDFWKRRALCRITSQPLCLRVRAEKGSLLLFGSFPLRIWKRLARVGTANIVPVFSFGIMQTLWVLQLLAQGQYGIKIWNLNSLIVVASLGICYMH